MFAEPGSKRVKELDLHLRKSLEQKDFDSFRQHHDKLGVLLNEKGVLLPDLLSHFTAKHKLYGMAAEAVANNRMTPGNALELVGARLNLHRVHDAAIKDLTEAKAALDKIHGNNLTIQLSHSISAPSDLHEAYKAHLNENIAKIRKIREKNLSERF